MTRWSEAQLAAVQQRRASPARREPRKPAATPVAVGPDEIEIPWLTPTPNQWQRMHFRAKRRVLEQLAQLTAVTRPHLVHRALTRARITVTRYSSVAPDPDAVTFVKPILDMLQRPSKRHPYGIGAIVDDDSKTVELVTEWKPCPPKLGRVIVKVEPLC
jgi:hypothetical protein